jgi:Protein of unknown function (DUF3833)
MNQSRLNSILAALCLSVLVVGCSSMKPQDFSTAVPRFEPDKFFEGPVQSWGVIETRSGRPKSRVRASLTGRRDGSDVVITQNFTFEDGHTQQRVWKIRRIDDHRYEAAANDVIGPAVGYAFGNAFHWEYTLQLRPRNIFSRVRMEHWMYLLGDGQTMLNRVVIRKFGIILAQTTEYFQRGSAPVPTVEAR